MNKEEVLKEIQTHLRADEQIQQVTNTFYVCESSISGTAMSLMPIDW